MKESFGSRCVYGVSGTAIGLVAGTIAYFLIGSINLPSLFFLPVVFGIVLGALSFLAGRRFLHAIKEVFIGLFTQN